MDCCCHKTKHRSDEEQRKLTHRLNRIEGQVRGLREMLQKDAYCPDILIQVSAVSAALNSFSKELLATTDYSITEVAQSSGFSSQSYFAQCFLKHCRMTASAYRKACRSE